MPNRDRLFLGGSYINVSRVDTGKIVVIRAWKDGAEYVDVPRGFEVHGGSSWTQRDPRTVLVLSRMKRSGDAGYEVPGADMLEVEILDELPSEFDMS